MRHRTQAATATRARSRQNVRLRARLKAELGDLLERDCAQLVEAAVDRIVAGTSDPYSESEALWQTLRAH